MGRQTWIDSNVFSTAQDAEELIFVALIPVKQLDWSKRHAIQLQIWLIIIQNIMQCWVITNVIKGRRILKTKISAERGTN